MLHHALSCCRPDLHNSTLISRISRKETGVRNRVAVADDAMIRMHEVKLSGCISRGEDDPDASHEVEIIRMHLTSWI